MATVDGKNYTKTYSGLKSTAITAGAFIVGGLLIKEVVQRIRRYPDEDRARKRGEGEGLPDRGPEAWALGYIFRARTYVCGIGSPDYPRWPLFWIWEAIKRKEEFYEVRSGADATTYIRFLRGTFRWMSFLLLIVFPIMLAINYVYAGSTYSFDSIDRTSLTALVNGTRGLNLLPIHVIGVWTVMLSWFVTLFWIARGVLRIRRNELRRLLADDAERVRLGDHAEDAPIREDFSPELDPRIPAADLGWRYRTVLVRNLPVGLRTEAALQTWFEERFQTRAQTAGAPEMPATDGAKPAYPPTASVGEGSSGSDSAATSVTEPLPFIAEIVLVRRQIELNELWFSKYQAVLNDLETAHVRLARNVIDWVRVQVKKEEAAKAGVQQQSPFDWFKAHGPHWRHEKADVAMSEKANSGHDALLIESLRPYCTRPSSLAPVHETLWEALERLRRIDPTILDRFQPQYKLRHFRKASVPAIDYFLTKHNLLYSLIEDQRAREEEIETASTAFITFSRASDARRVREKLNWSRFNRLRKGKVFDLQAKLAPENRDLHWQRLILVSLSSDILRSALLNGAIWGLTIVWVIPISLLIGLFSLESLQRRLPGLATWLANHDVANSLFTGLLPTAIVLLLNMYSCTLIGIAKRKGLTLITESAWSASTQSAYWKFMVTNLLVIFCIGITAFSAALNAFNTPTTIFQVVAAAFPKGATFYVSYVLLQVGTQTGIEISLFGITWINHISIRKMVAPRKRASEGLPRFFGYQSYLPQHLFQIAIVLVFAILNPVVIAFGFLFFGFILVVFKQQFAHVYYRRNFESGGRQVFRRLFRYSLDIAILAQVVYVAFFWTLKRFGDGGGCIPLLPITVFIKIVGTRWFDHLMDELDEAKIDLICGEKDPAVALSTPLEVQEEDKKTTLASARASLKNFLFITLPALVRHPAARLPRIGQQARLATHWKKGRRARTGKSRNPMHRFRKHATGDNDQRPILQASQRPAGTGPDESPDLMHSPEVQHTTVLPAPTAGGDTSQEPTPAQAAAAARFLQEKAVTTRVSAGEEALVTPHPPVLRDDRPVSHLRYRNPAQHTPLVRALWLPRDPLQAVDLADTIDLHTAFVSSAAGRGVLGTWDEIGSASSDGGSNEGIVKAAPEEVDVVIHSPSMEFRQDPLANKAPSLSPPTLRRRRSSQSAVNAEDASSPSTLPPPLLTIDPTLALGAGSVRSPASVPLPPSPATPLGRPPSLVLTHAERSRDGESLSTRNHPLASPARSSIRSSPGPEYVTSSSPTSQRVGVSPTRVRTRASRSESIATVFSDTTSRYLRDRPHAPTIAEADEDSQPVSQNEAMRNELLEEERKSHLAHAQRDEARRRKERDEVGTRSGKGNGSLLRKLLLFRDENAIGDET